MRSRENEARLASRYYVWLMSTGTVVFVFLASIYLLVPRWISYMSASAINQLDTDFLYFHYLHENIHDYSNILIANVVERVYSSFGVLLWLSSYLSELGVAPGFQIILFFYAQVLLGVIGIFLIVKGLALSREEIILVFAFFLFSYFTQFGRYIGGPGFYNKVTASCFAMSIGYVIIAFFINGSYRLSVVTSALLMYIHPVYGAVLLALNGSYGVKAYFFDRSWTGKYTLLLALMGGLVLMPFIYGLHTSSGVIASGGIGPLWWGYLKAKTSNPFPLQDGLVIVIPSLLVFLIAHRLLGRIGTVEAAGPFGRARWVLGGVIAAWLIQILFTELIPVSLVARLSLTRTTPFGLLFAVIAYVGTVWRYRDRDESGLWLLLLIAPAILGVHQLISDEAVRAILGRFSSVMTALGGYWPDFATYPDILLIFLILVVFAIRVGAVNGPRWLCERFEKRPRGAQYILIGAAGLLAVVIFVEISALSRKWSGSTAASVVSCVVLLMWLVERLIPRVTTFSSVAVWARTRSTALVFVLVMAITVSPAVKSANALFSTTTANTDVERMWSYIERNTKKNEMILVVPFFDTRKFPVMPLRPVFVDWGDGQYVLYDYQILDQVIERLSLIGMNVDKALRAEQCDGAAQYVDAMCRRKLFESLSEDYSDAWRDNLPRMREIAPNLTYVMMRSKYVRPADNVIYRSEEISLIRL